jgi:hypothetical protein
MTVSELIEELVKYDPDLPVGVVVSYKDPCNCADYEDSRCYCEYTDHEHCIESVSKEEDIKKKTIKKLWIRGV